MVASSKWPLKVQELFNKEKPEPREENYQTRIGYLRAMVKYGKWYVEHQREWAAYCQEEDAAGRVDRRDYDASKTWVPMAREMLARAKERLDKEIADEKYRRSPNGRAWARFLGC